MIVEIILLVLLIICLYIIYNLNKKTEQYETWFESIREQVSDTNVKLNEIDVRGSFSSDDEIGFYFKYMKDLQNELSKYFNLEGKNAKKSKKKQYFTQETENAIIRYNEQKKRYYEIESITNILGHHLKN